MKTLFLFFLWTKEFLCFSLKDALQAQQAPERPIQEVCTSLYLAPLSLGSPLASRLVQYTLPNCISYKTEGLVRLKSKLVLFTILHAIYGWAKLKQLTWKISIYVCAVCALFLFQFILYMNKVQSRESLTMNNSLSIKSRNPPKAAFS